MKKSNLKFFQNGVQEKNYFYFITYSGLTQKCVTNGDLPEKDELLMKFEEITVDCREEQIGEMESYPDFILISIDWPPKI